MNREKILLAHGAGGKLTRQLIREVMLRHFANPVLERLEDAAVLDVGGARIAYSTDSFVVDPIFFRGGDIGKLAVNGTVNDIAMCGGSPLHLTASFIIEEGFPIRDLERIAASMEDAAAEAGVSVVAGDTKVVDSGSADKIFINTSGIGVVERGVNISSFNARPGDKVVVNGFIGDHGVAILSEREGLRFETSISSDCAPLNGLVQEMLSVTNEVHVLRDPTRGGLATVLNEIALDSGVGIVLDEERIPVREEVRGACEMLGLDPLYVANEGKLVAIASPSETASLVRRMRENRYGRDAQVIGEITEEPAGTVVLRTRVGGKRIVDMLVGEQLPRIC